MKVGDLVRCIEGACMTVDGGIGVVIQEKSYEPDGLSICVQWAHDFLWYEEKDLEVISD